MTDSYILAVQIESDLIDLEKDVEAGLYPFPERYKDYMQVRDRIMKKIWQLEELKKTEEEWRCGECGEIRIGDERIKAGMKCGHCAYGY